MDKKAHDVLRGDAFEYDPVLGPKARPIPALGNAQGTSKPLRSPHDQGRWPWLVWVAPLVLKANAKHILWTSQESGMSQESLILFLKSRLPSVSLTPTGSP